MSFIGELKRRNVIRVAILYFVSSWLLLQLTDVLQSILPVPEWTGSFVFMMLLICLAPALIFAWVYEMTPDGLKREKDVDRTQSVTPDTGKKINGVIVILLVLAIVGMLADRLIPEKKEPPAAAEDVTSTQAVVDRASIAVLPFADMSEQGDQQFFTDGLSEELLNLLVRIDGLSVASRTSAFAYRGSTLSIPSIANELGVAHVLEGSVRKAGDRIRVTAQLIEAATDRHLWSDTFDRELIDIFTIQDEIGNAIVSALKDELGILEEVSVGVTAVTSNVDAYQLYLEARELFIRRVNLSESIRLFNEAIALDPGFAKAWEGLAAVEMVADEWIFDDGISHTPLALEAANKALELEPDLSMPYAVIGNYSRDFLGMLADAMRNFDIALRNDPMNTTALLWQGITFIYLAYFDDAIRVLERCLEIDPGYLNCTQFLSSAYLYTGMESRAVELFEQTLEHNFHSLTEIFIPYYVRSGQRNLALALADIKSELSAAPVIEYIRAIENPDAENSAGLERWRQWERETNSGLGLRHFPMILLAFGEFENAADSMFINFLVWHPDGREFRSTPHFKRFIFEGGVLAYWQEKGFPDYCRPVGDDDFECDDPY